MLLLHDIDFCDIVDHFTLVAPFASLLTNRLFVIFPKIAQSSVSGSILTIEFMNLTNPVANGFHLTLESKLDHTGPIAATLDPMNLSLLTQDGQLLGNIPTPEIHAVPSGTVVTISQFFEILDLSAFNRFTSGLLENSTAIFEVSGATTLHALGHATNVRFTKTLNMTGLDGVSNIAVTNFELPAVVPGGIELISTTLIPNPSNVSIFMGNATFGILYDGILIANITADDMMYGPGQDNTTMHGLLLADAFTNASLATQLFSAIIAGKPVNSTVVGQGATVNGTDIPWLTNIVTSIDAPIILQQNSTDIIQGVNLTNISLAFTPEGGTMSADIEADIRLPFPFPLQIKFVSTHLDILLMNDTLVATLTGDQQPAQNTNTTLTTSIKDGVLDIIDPAGFGQILQEQLLQSSASFKVHGEVNATVQTPVGVVDIPGIEFQQTFVLQGTRGFGSSAPTLGSVTVTGSDAGGIYLDIPTTLDNPSDITASVGTIYLQLLHNDADVGVVRLDDFVASPGIMHFISHAYLTIDPSDPGSPGALRDLLSRFAMGETIQTTFHGSRTNSTAIPALQSAMAGISLSAQAAGLSTGLIGSASLNLGIFDLLGNGITADVTLTNPLGVSLEPEHIQAILFLQGTEVATIDTSLSKVIPANSSGVLTLPITPVISLDALVAEVSHLSNLTMALNSTILLSIGEYQTTIDYDQPALQVSL